ncbi:MAG: GNAT family N-acetyltransferase [Rhodobacteraceae bacterium]|nr:GNAT family N-acetyltransferase [Paracoccaceae bacterium]
MNVIVRPVTSADEPIWRELWCEYLAFYETSRPEEVYAETWARILDNSEDLYSCLAESEGSQVVGLVNFLYHKTFWDIEYRCYLNDLYTTPQARGLGVGKALIEAVVSHAKKHNSASVYWLTAADNAPARRLYDHVATLTPFVKYQV